MNIDPTKALAGLSGQPSMQTPAQYELQYGRQPGLNWDQILASQVARGLMGAIANNSPNSYQNAVLDFNKKRNPTDYLGQNPNYSLQDYYGIKEEGGIADSEIENWIMQDREAKQEQPMQNSAPVEAAQVVDVPSDEEVYNSIDWTTRTPNWKKDLDSDDMPVFKRTSGKVDLTGIDPQVLAATNEVLSKFPGLKITSGKRNWGDKDAHPIGEAIDVSGDKTTLAAAHEYYAKEIVPKYSFNKALPTNHGTGPHIHVGKYADGGQLRPKAYNPNLAKDDKDFIDWYQKNTLEGKANMPYTDKQSYDYYSFYRNKGVGDIERHFPDTYKRPSHPTFSNESIYSIPENPGGSWKGEIFIPPQKLTRGTAVGVTGGYYAKGGNVNLSIQDRLEAQGMDGSYAARKAMYDKQFSGQYTGSAEQNMQLLRQMSSQVKEVPIAARRQVRTAPPLKQDFHRNPRHEGLQNDTRFMNKPAQPVRQAGQPLETIQFRNGMVDTSRGYKPQDPTQPLRVSRTDVAPYADAYKNELNPFNGIDPKAAMQSGFAVDKRSNMGMIVKDGKVVREFPVLTGNNPDLNNNPYTKEYLAKHPELKNTPVGYYGMVPGNEDEFGGDLMYMNPLAGPLGTPDNTNLAAHATFDPANRDKLYNMSAKDRNVSYGCINCQKPDRDALMNAFPKGDTLMVLDSKNAAQAAMLNSFKRQKKEEGGEVDDYKKGGWIKEATKGMRKDKPCTGSKFGSSSCPPGSKRYNLAKTFRKMNKKEHGGYVEGEELDLDPKEVQNLINQGYDLEFL